MDLLSAKTSAFSTDLLSLKAQSTGADILLDYLRFAACSVILSYFSRNKYFNHCYDWIANSLSEEISSSIERTYSPGLPLRFINYNHPFAIETIDLVLSGWVHDLFYYSRHTGGNKELSEYYLNNLLPWFITRAKNQRSIDYAMALSQMSTWCFNFQYAPENKQIQQAMVAIHASSPDTEVKKLIAFHFSCLLVNETSLTRDQWSQEVISSYSHLLHPHEKFQIMANRWENNIDDIIFHFEEIISTIKQYADTQRSFHGSLFNHIQSTLFTILNHMISTLLSNGQVRLTNRLYGAYFGIDEKQLIAPQNLYIAPGLDEGTLYSAEESVFVASVDSNTLISELLHLQNAFLGTSFTRHDDMSFIPKLSIRQGVPDPDDARAYELGLRNLFRTNNLGQRFEISKFNGYYLLFGAQLPLQSILTVDTGTTIPLIHSFYDPLPANKIRKIFIWQGFTQMAEYERLGLEEIFRLDACEVTFANCWESTKDDFLMHYSKSDYDLVWILGHGQFNHQSAHLAYLDLGNEISVSIDELISAPLTHAGRRLLIIDACDGANSALSNNPASIGIAASAVGKRQSVMSHHWPIEDILGLILGLLVASYLTSGRDYARAHHDAVVKFREGKPSALEHLSTYIKNQEVLDRIQNRDIDHSNFYYWGSLSYII